MRQNWRMLRLTRRIVADIQHVLDSDASQEPLTPHVPDDGVVHLWSPERGPLPAGVNYADL